MTIIKEEKKVLKNLKKGNDAYAKMPIFIKEDDGTWTFSGEYAVIHTIEEYNRYKEVYAEILGFIQQNFASSISSVYKNALNSLVYYSGKSQVSDLMTTLSKGKSVTLGKVFNQANSQNLNDSTASINHIINGVNAKNGKLRKPFKPYKLTGKGSDYIFPEFSENGVVAKVENKKITVNFKAVSAEEAERLKEYMLSCVPGSSVEEKNLRFVVNQYFDYSKYVAELIKKGNASQVYDAFSALNEMSSRLFETDLTKYEKPTANSQGVDDLDYTTFDDFDGVGDQDDAVFVEEADDKVVGFDFKTGYKTETVFGEGGPAIRISPVDGSFVVTFDEKTKIYTVDKAKELGE